MALPLCRLYLITPPSLPDLDAFARVLEAALGGGDVAAAAGGDGAASMGSPGEEDVGSNFGAAPTPSCEARRRSTGNQVRSNVPARLRALSFATLEKTEEEKSMLRLATFVQST